MGDDDDARLDHRQQRDAAVEVVDHDAVAFFLAVERTGDAARHHALEMHRHAFGRERDHLRLDGRVARRHQKPEPRSPAYHGVSSVRFRPLAIVQRSRGMNTPALVARGGDIMAG